MFVLLYVHNIIFSSLCLASCSIVGFGNNTLNMLRKIKIPSLPVSILYLSFSFLSDNNFKLCYYV